MAEYKLNITPNFNPPTIAISQNDVGRAFSIYLYGENREAYQIPDGATVKLLGTKPSGLGFTVTGTWTGSTVTFETTAEMSDEAGTIPCEVRIINGDMKIGSANARLFVEKNPHPDSTTDGTAEEVISEITVLVNRAEAAADAAEAALAEFTGVTATATTLEAGSQATASYADGVLTLGIPAGATGPQGETGPAGPQGQTGATGSAGTTFTPSVDANGNISWTNDGGKQNPTTRNIKGPQGETGATGPAGSDGTTFTPSVNSAGDLSWTNDGGKQNPQTVNIKGPQGETGPAYVLTAQDKADITADVLAQLENAEQIGM